MPLQPENVGTFTLSGESITIVQAWGVRNVSVSRVSGTVIVTGTMKLGARNSDPITLGDKPLNVSFDFPIDGYTIDASGGVALLVTGK